jgi:hypothetical protein
MDAEKVVRVKCQFTRSGFPAERIFHIQAPGEGVFTGSAPVQYCYMNDGTPFREDIPRGRNVPGYVAGVALGPGAAGQAVRVYLPDGEVYEVSEDLIQTTAGGRHVPVQS